MFGQEQAEDAVAIERGNGEEVEKAQEDIEGEESAESGDDAIGDASGGRGRDHTGKEGCGRGEPADQETEAEDESCDEREGEIGDGSGERHPGGAFGITLGPLRVIRGTGPADETGAGSDAEQGDDDHAKGFPADVGNRGQGDLATFQGSIVAAEFGDKGVSGFVAGGGKQEYHVLEEARCKQIRIHPIVIRAVRPMEVKQLAGNHRKAGQTAREHPYTVGLNHLGSKHPGLNQEVGLKQPGLDQVALTGN